jgi:hypothetical protein
VDRGYVPTPSLVRGGPQVLGHAACLVPAE